MFLKISHLKQLFRGGVKPILSALTTVLLTMPLSAQEHSVSGTVTDTDGNPVIGAAVMIPGSNTGVTTDIDGSFTLGGIAPDTEIEVSCLGFATQRVKVSNRSEIDFTLEV